MLREIRSPWYADRRRFAREMLWNNFVNGSSVLMRRRAFDAVGGFPTSPRFQADGIMWFAMLARGAFGHLPELLTSYRIHPGQGSQDVARLQRDMATYYRRALSHFRLDDLFGDRLTGPADRAAAYRELGDILAYRQLAGPALSLYLRSVALGGAAAPAGLAAARACAVGTRPAARAPAGPQRERAGDGRRRCSASRARSGRPSGRPTATATSC